MASLFAGVTLYNKDGAEVDSSVLEGKTIGILFTDSQEFECHQTTYVLKEFYDAVQQEGAQFEVVCAALEKSEEDAAGYKLIAHDNWYYLAYGDALTEELRGKFDVQGPGTLVIVKANGDVASTNAQSDLTEQTMNAVERLDKFNNM